MDVSKSMVFESKGEVKTLFLKTCTNCRKEEIIRISVFSGVTINCHQAPIILLKPLQHACHTPSKFTKALLNRPKRRFQ
jgi:hypothetical protein